MQLQENGGIKMQQPSEQALIKALEFLMKTAGPRILKAEQEKKIS